MKKFRKVLREINLTVFFFTFFEAILNAILFFAILYFLLSLINLWPLLALIPAGVYFVMRMLSDSQRDKRKLVESKYGPLKEKLRTAADNMKLDNEVVEALQEEVIHDMKGVTVSSFMNMKTTSYKLLAIIVLSFAVLLTTTTNLYIVDINQVFNDLPGLLDARIAGSIDAPIGDVNESNDIYGDSKLAVLGNEEVDIKIQPVNYEVNVRESGDVEQKEFDSIFPGEIAIEQSSAFEEEVPEEQQELVKSYFENLAKQ